MIWNNLYNYQQESIKKLLNHPKSILGLEAGLGKTITSLAWLEIMNNNLPISCNWILCAKSKIKEWEEDCAKWNLNTITLNKSTIKNSELIQKNPNTIYIVGYHAFANLYKSGNIPQTLNQLMIFDESQRLNGDNSNISKSVINLCKDRLPYVMLLSGTLHSTGYHDLANQCTILDIVRDKYHFENKYLIMENREFNGIKTKILSGYKNIDNLILELNNKGSLITSKDIYLPQRTRIEEFIEVTKSPEYDILNKHQVIDFYMAPNAGTKFQGLRMLCSNFISKDKEKVHYEPHKKQALKRVLSDSNNNKKRFLIFYNWNEELAQIEDICAELNRPLSYINGSKHNRDNFYKNENGIIAIQYQSGSEGVDGLQIANRVIYYSPTLSGGLFEQSQKRIDRIGQQENEVYYYYLRTPNTIEEDIYKNLTKYKSYTQKIWENKN